MKWWVSILATIQTQYYITLLLAITSLLYCSHSLFPEQKHGQSKSTDESNCREYSDPDCIPDSDDDTSYESSQSIPLSLIDSLARFPQLSLAQQKTKSASLRKETSRDCPIKKHHIGHQKAVLHSNIAIFCC